MNEKIKELLLEIKKKCSDASKIEICTKELMDMDETDSVSKGTVLDEFYKVWKNKKDQPGAKNEINSWSAYYLGITSVKPKESNNFLPSRRIFARAGFPDIDADFEFEKRQQVYDYLINKYGRDRVGNIGTYGTLKLKSYVTRVVKALDLANSFHKGKDPYVKENNILVRKIIDSLPEQKGAFLKVWDEDGDEHVIKSLQDAYDHCHSFKSYLDEFPDIKAHADAIEGLSSNFGVHAAGVVISDDPLKTIAPLRSTSGGSSGKSVDYATQFPYEDLEYLGLIKFDILALSTLSVISKTVKLIKERNSIDLDMENLNLNDERTFELYRSGNLIGVFQCEEKGMQKTMMEMSVDRFEDICAGIALFRPGPMASIPKYCSRKKGKEKIEYFHPSIEPFVKDILEPTYGVLCYQESIMQLCNKLAGLSISDGYVIIKAVGKKKEDLLKRYRTKFVSGCVKNGIKEKIADDYWEKFIMPFAAYGFNKSHSFCYGLLSYQTAYLKANFPHEFMLSYLNVELGQKKWERIEILEKECQRMGIKISSRNINVSKEEYSMRMKRDLSGEICLFVPPLYCKGITAEAVYDICRNQPFKDLKDFAFKTSKSSVDIESLQALVDNGYFPGVEDVVSKFENYREYFIKSKKRGVSGLDLFG